MRSGKIIFVLSLTLFAGLALVIGGCSDDDTPTKSQPTDQDLNYAAVTDEANELLDSTVSTFAATLEVFSLQVPVDTAINVVYSPINPDSISSSNNWYVMFASDLATGYSWSQVDSLQFKKNGVSQEAAFNADQVSLRHYFELQFGDTTSMYRNREGYANFEFTGLNTNTATINGVRQVAISSRAQVNNVTWRRDYSMELSFNNVTIPRADGNWLRGCPSTGTVTGTISLVAAKGSNPETESTWEFEMSFDYGQVDVTVTSGEFTQTYTTTVCEL